MGLIRIFCVGALFVPLMLSLFTSVEGRIYSTTATVLSDIYPYLTPKYDRVKEAERACEEVIDSASELGSNDNRAYISHDLSFTGGDWDQEPGATHPLLPFADVDSFNDSDVYLGSPYKLTKFRVTDVDFEHRSKKTVNVNGVLDLVITSNGPVSEAESSELTNQFQMWKGHTQTSVFFQGIYTESEENGGERVLCLLGSANLPTRQSDPSHPWRYLNLSDSVNYHLPTWQDDQILLVLHYPMLFTLTQRAIIGEMRSLSLKTNPKYFDKVRILSQLTTQEYKFGSPAVHKACDPYPYSDNLLAGGIDIYKGHDFCSFFEEIQHRGPFIAMPNWRCNGMDEFCSKLGPFLTDDKEIIGTHGGFKDVRLFVQNVHCQQKRVKGNVTVAKVSLVLRVVPHGNYIEWRRSGLGNMTLAAEGEWKSSNGQLCMVGCLGIADSNACDSRVCIYIQTTLSISQRNSLVGSISSIKAKTSSYPPLSFQFPIRIAHVSRFWRYTSLHYTYSKIGFAGALMEKYESSSFGMVIKKSLLTFPRLQENEDYDSSFSLLAEDLTFNVLAVLDPSPKSLSQPFVGMNVLSVGSIFRPYPRFENFSFYQVSTPYHEKAEYTTKQLLVNVSATLSIHIVADTNFSSLSVEGLYDPLVGKMYLIGCRNVQASSKILLESNDLENGFDCLTEVIISYPPVTAQWLLNPSARISIKSQRPEDDPFYFKPVSLKTLPITYRSQREGALSEREIEGVLLVLTLSVAVACVLLQLLHIRTASDSLPFVSLVMLGIQAFGFGLPLITGVESLFQTKHTNSNKLGNSQLFDAISHTAKLLILMAFLLTLRLLQKVWKSRVRMLRNEPRRVPNEKLVLLVTSAIHIAGFVCALYVHASKPHQAPVFGEFGSVEISTRPKKQWMTILVEEYFGVVQDLFLFPQVVGNLVWKIECTPLRKLYYIGISIVRLLPHVYDYYFKASMLNPYFSTDYDMFVNPDTDFYSKFSDVFIPAMTVILAVLVYVQQRWSHRLLPLRSKLYRKVPTDQSFEAELASTRDQEA